MGALIIQNFPEELRKALKIKAVTDEVTMQHLIIEILASKMKVKVTQKKKSRGRPKK